MTDEFKAARDAANEKHYNTCQPPWADHFNAGADWAYNYVIENHFSFALYRGLQDRFNKVKEEIETKDAQIALLNAELLEYAGMTDSKEIALLKSEIERLTNESVQDAATISMLEAQIETKDKQIALLTEALEEYPNSIYAVKALAKSKELGE